jgi:cysteine desulfurase
MTESDVKRVYLDNAATTMVRQEVLDAMLPVFQDNFGNASSIYKEGQRAKATLEDARARVAKCLNAEPAEIYFTSCGSESDNWAIKGTALRHAAKGKHIITTAIEHHAVLHSCEALAKQGYEITYLPVDEYGLVDPEDVRKAIRPDTILVTVMMANNEIGTVEPIEEIAKICREKKVLFHTDAVQAGGSIPVDVKALGVDMLSLSGHKLHAPKGVGLLYIRKGTQISNFMDGGAQRETSGPEPRICLISSGLPRLSNLRSRRWTPILYDLKTSVTSDPRNSGEDSVCQTERSYGERTSRKRQYIFRVHRRRVTSFASRSYGLLLLERLRLHIRIS